MATVLLDSVETLEVHERFGNIDRLVRKMIVIGLSATTYAAAFDALAASGVPPAGSSLAAAPNCIVTDRQSKMIDGDKAEVTITYEFALNEGYDMDSPPFGVVFGEGGASLSQAQSNVDADGTPIFVEHTYPSDDQDYPSKTIDQGGQIDFMQPQASLKFKGLKSNDTPGATSKAMVGYVNGDTWNGGAVGQWLCTRADYKLFDQASSPARYFWELEFQFNIDGWDPTVIFVDDRTGKPPKDLVLDVGYKQVTKYPQVDFDIAFGATLVGE